MRYEKAIMSVLGSPMLSQKHLASWSLRNCHQVVV